MPHSKGDDLGVDRNPDASAEAAEHSSYSELGLTDAAIAAASRATGCAVLTDDLALYLRLSSEKASVFNSSHLQAAEWVLIS